MRFADNRDNLSWIDIAFLDGLVETRDITRILEAESVNVRTHLEPISGGLIFQDAVARRTFSQLRETIGPGLNTFVLTRQSAQHPVLPWCGDHLKADRQTLSRRRRGNANSGAPRHVCKTGENRVTARARTLSGNLGWK